MNKLTETPCSIYVYLKPLFSFLLIYGSELYIFHSACSAPETGMGRVGDESKSMHVQRSDGVEVGRPKLCKPAIKCQGYALDK